MKSGAEGCRFRVLCMLCAGHSCDFVYFDGLTSFDPLVSLVGRHFFEGVEEDMLVGVEDHCEGDGPETPFGFGFSFPHTDMAFLHYRSGGFMLQRARQKPEVDMLRTYQQLRQQTSFKFWIETT